MTAQISVSLGPERLAIVDPQLEQRALELQAPHAGEFVFGPHLLALRARMF